MQIDSLADSIFLSFKAYCAKEVDRRVARSHEELLARIAEIPAGKDGAPGPQGEAGKDGIDGKDGAPGRDGIDGKDGRDGIDGKDGAAGRDGAPGLDGKDGAPGRDGIDGKDGAPGIAGKDGRDGIDGKDGAPGRDGKDGADGLHGKDGAAGKDGAPGLKGIDGRDGRDGKEGAPGRDALRLDVLDTIDFERAYPRNTYASHNGGLLCATRTTDPVIDGDLFKAGWKIIVNGIADIDLEALDERCSKIRVRTTCGKQFEHILRVPGIAHRGVWKAGAGYERGDLVTWGGSLWHCERATSAKPQEFGCDDWKLAVKKGRDGENGKPGERGPQGLPGAPGRDFTNLGVNVR